MLTSIDPSMFSARLGLFCTANILQIADAALRVFSLLSFPCFSYYFA